MIPRRIGFGTRVAATLVDWVLVAIATFVLSPAIGGLLGAAAGLGAGGDPAAAVGGGVLGGMLAVMVAAPLLATVYFAVEAVTGWTPGKRALGIQIANADGTRADLETLLARFAIKNSQWVLGLLGGLTGVALIETLGGVAGLVIFVGCFLVLGEARQSLHDKAAGTAVFARSDVSEA